MALSKKHSDGLEMIPEKLRKFVEAETIIGRSPGRINLIGEHTDYNEGFVLPAAIDKAAFFALTPNNSDHIRLIAADLNETIEQRIDEIRPIAHSWTNYIFGVVDQFMKAGIIVSGFDAVLTADVPTGAGLSSSAAVECATGITLNDFLQASVDRITLVKMAQQAEHVFAKVQCGIMDQFASGFGAKNHAIRLDCRSLEYEYVPLLLDDVSILLFDTGVTHALASTEYNTRREECAQGVQLVAAHVPDVKSLRDVTMAMLDRYIAPENTLVFRRCKYVIEENSRLLNACKNLQQNDLVSLGQRMFESHDGLRDLYEVSCRELDFLVDFVKNKEGIYGARMMGGGFGGCTINLVKNAVKDELIETLSSAYRQFSGIDLTVYTASVADGSSIVYGGHSHNS